MLDGFDLGAEDYVTKPFNMKILLRRVAAALRRSGNQSAGRDDMRWSDGFLVLDFGALTAQRGGEILSITPNEYKLLRALTGKRRADSHQADPSGTSVGQRREFYRRPYIDGDHEPSASQGGG